LRQLIDELALLVYRALPALGKSLEFIRRSPDVGLFDSREHVAAIMAELRQIEVDATNATGKETSDLPPDRQTRPLDVTEAGVLMGLEPRKGARQKRRDAARKAMSRMMEGGLWHKVVVNGNRPKYAFDREAFPRESRDKV
jgi:hypothetical protein